MHTVKALVDNEADINSQDNDGVITLYNVDRVRNRYSDTTNNPTLIR